MNGWSRRKYGMPTLFSKKAVETTANEILNMMANRFDYRGRKLDSPYTDEVKD